MKDEVQGVIEELRDKAKAHEVKADRPYQDEATRQWHMGTSEAYEEIADRLSSALAASAGDGRDALWRKLVVPGLRVYKGDYVVQIDAGKLGLFTERYENDDDLPRAIRVIQDAALEARELLSVIDPTTQAQSAVCSRNDAASS